MTVNELIHQLEVIRDLEGGGEKIVYIEGYNDRSDFVFKKDGETITILVDD